MEFYVKNIDSDGNEFDPIKIVLKNKLIYEIIKKYLK